MKSALIAAAVGAAVAALVIGLLRDKRRQDDHSARAERPGDIRELRSPGDGRPLTMGVWRHLRRYAFMIGPLQAAIVDLDGTMVDTLGDFTVALNRMLDELGLPGIEQASIERLVGKGSEHLIRSVLAQVGAAPRCMKPPGSRTRNTTGPSTASGRRCSPA